MAREALASRSHFELDELRQFVGRDGGPIVLAMCGRVYDVTDGREYYGENGPYHALTGHDASRLLAKGMLEPESAEQQAVPLRRFELEQLRDWKTHYEQKYVFIGQLVGGHDPLAAMDCEAEAILQLEAALLAQRPVDRRADRRLLVRTHRGAVCLHERGSSAGHDYSCCR